MQMEQLYARRQAAYAPGARPHRCVAAGSRNRRAHPGVDWVLKYLVISDIHANLEALDAVLTAAGRYDHALVLGDLVGYGADPNAVIDRVRALPAATFIRGNHDKVGAGLENTDGFNYLARHAIDWTANTLTPDHRAVAGRACRRDQSSSTISSRSATARRSTRTSTSSTTSTRCARCHVARRPLCLFGHTHVVAAFTLDW